MNIKRWIAVTLISLLLIGAMGFFSYRVFASANGAQQDCPGEVQEDETQVALETEESDADECAQGSEAEVADSNVEDQTDEYAPVKTTISVEQAQAIVEAANPGTTTLNVEFDHEWGITIWEVELDNGMDVKVDATTGEILASEQRD